MSRLSQDNLFFTSYGLSCVRWNPGPMKRPDHHNEIQINMLAKGRVTYLLGGSVTRVRPGSLTAFWAAIPHQIIDYDADTEYFVATLPLAWFLQGQLPETLVQPLMRGEPVEDPSTDRVEMDTALFRQWERDLREKKPGIRDIVTAEMKTRLQRLALAQTTEGGSGKARKQAGGRVGGLNKVERMVCHIAQHYMDEVRADDIGRVSGMHPNAAMRLFKKTFGRTLVEHLTHHRIFHAKRLLATTDQKIADIAFGSGFNSISRFNEAFRAASGSSPREFRAAYAINDGVV